MKMPQGSDSFQKLAQFGVQTAGRIVMIGLVGILVSMWRLPNCRMVWPVGFRAVENERQKKNKQVNKE
jgi:hypothetical protein